MRAGWIVPLLAALAPGCRQDTAPDSGQGDAGVPPAEVAPAQPSAPVVRRAEAAHPTPGRPDATPPDGRGADAAPTHAVHTQCTPAAASCATDEDCVDLQTFCNVSTGGCVPGCRLDPRWNSCGPDLTCMEDHVCAICDRICGEYVVSCNEPCPRAPAGPTQSTNRTIRKSAPLLSIGPLSARFGSQS